MDLLRTQFSVECHSENKVFTERTK